MELEPDDVKRVIVVHFLFDLAHESGIKGREKKLGGGEVVRLVVLVVTKNLLGAESLRCRDGVARVAPDDVRHHGGAFGIGEVSDGVHPAVDEMVPNGVLEVDETTRLGKEGRHAGTTKVVPLL
ncbi:hypothetical protein MHU86_16552 [Fragilaria crotonensis]|nr:hypothetical protein MHU86_16552 [Fragilaria crotonensis]